ncbi:hypothetical protein [Dokdonia sp.]|uniref:hypothetical protein n=1 Tax=Dokdonia sp. TaxID=2024995 RepID=UPI0032679495
MIKLFKRNKININSISIPSFDWNKDNDERHFKQWTNVEQGISLSVNFFDKKPDLPTIKNAQVMRDFYRERISANNGGLIQIDIIDLKGHPTLKSIFKFPQQPVGMAYLSSLIIPFENYSYVIKVQATEVGISGMRDNTIAMILLNQGKITTGDQGYEGWTSDPYNPGIKEGVLMNISEEEQYDTDFPNHPLSLLRSSLRQIESEISFGKELEKTQKFKQ